MDGLVFLAIVVLAIPVAVIYLLVAMAGVKRRMSELEARVIFLSRKAEGDPNDKSPETPAEVIAPIDEDVVTEEPKAEEFEPAKPVEPVVAARVEEKPDTEQAAAPEPTRSVVFNAERASASAAWMKENWFLAVAALSLVLAGVFLVQYGVENGLLTPVWRVTGAVVLGLAMVAAGEVLRRRFGDEAAGTAYLPSTFSGSGLVVLFAAVLAAHHLYGMMGEGATFFWLVLVACASVALGWFYGPYLTLVGILGALAAPFLIGGSSNTPQLFYGYFGLIAVTALLIDAIRRWAFVSVLGLIGASLASTYIFTLGAGDIEYLAFFLGLVVAAVLIPPLALTPRHGGAMLVEALWNAPSAGGRFPEFPTGLAFGTIVAATGGAVLVAMEDTGAVEVGLALAGIVMIYALVVNWSREAEALSDNALVALPALLAVLVWQAEERGTLFQVHLDGLMREPETAPPMVVSYLIATGVLVSALAYWRGLFPARYTKVWAAGAAIAAPSLALVLETNWRPADVLGDYSWALHTMAIAAAMVFGAVGVARRNGQDKERASYFALAAVVMIAFAMVVLYSKTALTLAVAVLILGSASVDRRFDLRLLYYFVVVGAVAIGWRLVVDPGFIWAESAPLWEVILAYCGSIAALTGSHWLLALRNRWQAQIIVASAAWLAGAVFAMVLLVKWLGLEDDVYHWPLSLMAMIWLISAAVQLWRLQIGGKWATRMRLGLASLFGVIGVGFLALALTMGNPLNRAGEVIRGPVIFDTLLVAYLLPALLFCAVAWRFDHLPIRVRQAGYWIAGLLGGVYVGLEIRHIWWGDDLSAPSVLDGELYSYTVAMLLVSVALLFLAFFRRSTGLRRVAIAGVALTIAKVFLIDMSGLTGLIRVASFLGLGLSLAGLAWVVRVMNAQWERAEE